MKGNDHTINNTQPDTESIANALLVDRRFIRAVAPLIHQEIMDGTNDGSE
jgi:hypothetical protein